MSTALVEANQNGVVHAEKPTATTAVCLPSGSACPNLSQALAAARDRCKAASKDGNNAFHKYKYATADEVISTAGEALQGSGIAIIPVCEELTVVNAGARSFYALNRTLILSHTSGEFVPLEIRSWPVIEEKGRPLDKAYAVALTTSLSYKLRDLLQMPRGDQFGDDMNERDDREHVPPTPAKPTPAAAHKLIKDAGLPVQFGSQLPAAGEIVATPITAQQAALLSNSIDGKFLCIDDFLPCYGLARIEDMLSDSYEEIAASVSQIVTIRNLAEELNIPPGKMLPDGETSFLALDQDGRAVIIQNLIATKERRAAKTAKKASA